MLFYVPVIKKIVIAFSLQLKNLAEIVQKEYILVVILWQPQNT